MAGTNKGRIGLILKIMSSSREFFSCVFDGGYFPTIADQAELAFLDDHYYF
jgi:hypothetical protein